MINRCGKNSIFAVKKCPDTTESLPMTPEEFWIMLDLLMYHDIYNGRSCLTISDIFAGETGISKDPSGLTRRKLSTKPPPSVTYRHSFRYRRVEVFDRMIPEDKKSIPKSEFKQWLKVVFIPKICQSSQIMKAKILENTVFHNNIRHNDKKKQIRKNVKERKRTRREH